MKPYTVRAHIHSLNGKTDEITVLRPNEVSGHEIPNSYIVEYKGIRCTAFLNPFNFQYYADDIYGRIYE